ncbi:hypothetical protein K0M31_006130, partial [Melipona bicolor]
CQPTEESRCSSLFPVGGAVLTVFIDRTRIKCPHLSGERVGLDETRSARFQPNSSRKNDRRFSRKFAAERDMWPTFRSGSRFPAKNTFAKRSRCYGVITAARAETDDKSQ